MEPRKITSVANPLVKEVCAIAGCRVSSPDEQFIAEGMHLAEAALRSSADIRHVFYTEDFSMTREGEELIRGLALRVPCRDIYEVTGPVLGKMADTRSPQGIIVVVKVSARRLADLSLKGDGLLAIADAIQDPGNMGTIIRIADAVGADAVIMLPGCCSAYMPKTVRSSAGSIFNLPVISAGYEELAGYIASSGIRLFAADARADRSLYDADFRGFCALAFGNEARGISAPLRQLAHELISIPMFGRAESLNAGVAASVCLYEAVRQRRLVKTVKTV